MAKGASTETELGNLHGLLTKLFTKVLNNYVSKIEAAEALTSGDVEDEVMAELLLTVGEPSPAMLSAISKFLKDNEITFDSEQIDALSGLEQRLKDKKARRPDFDNVTALPLTGTN